MSNSRKVNKSNWEERHKVNQISLFEDLIRILEVFKEPLKEENKKEYADLQKFFLEGEEKKCKVPFLSRVLKCPEDVLLATIHNCRYSKIEKFKEDKYKIKDLYFKVNETKVGDKGNQKKLFDLSRDYDRIIKIINKYSSYILSRKIIAEDLDLKYCTFNKLFSVTLANYQLSGKEGLVNIIEDIDKRIKEKISKSKKDLKDDFLKLLEGASKEALKSEEDLFYYLLLKDFYYFDMLSKYIEEGKDCDFMKICNEIYKKKFPESVENQEFFCENLFSSLLTKFTNFHNNNYLKRLEILEEKEKNYFASKNNKSIENESIKDNVNNNDASMISSYSHHNYCEKRKSFEGNDKFGNKRQRMNDEIVNNGRVNNERVNNEIIFDNYLKTLLGIDPNIDNSQLGLSILYNFYFLKTLIMQNATNNGLNQGPFFNLNQYYPFNFFNQNVLNPLQQVTYPTQQVTYPDQQQGVYPPQNLQFSNSENVIHENVIHNDTLVQYERV